GFALGDFVRFVNLLLGVAMDGRPASGDVAGAAPPSGRVAHHELPLVGAQVTIRRFGEPGDRELLDAWVADRDGRFFLLSTASGRTHDVDHLVQSPANLV